MPICYFYRMTSDSGFAPCVFEDRYKTSSMLSLACCKGGQIRKGKPVFTGLRYVIGNRHRTEDGLCKEEVYVTGILGKRIVFCARIKEIPTMTTYFSNPAYANRLDQIYSTVEFPCNGDKSDNLSFDNQLVRNDRYPLFHGSQSDYSSLSELENQHKRDKLGKYVLLSSDFSYYGNKDNCIIPENIIDLMPKRQEFKCYVNNQIIDEYVSRLVQDAYHSQSPTKKLTGKGCRGCRTK